VLWARARGDQITISKGMDVEGQAQPAPMADREVVTAPVRPGFGFGVATHVRPVLPGAGQEPLGQILGQGEVAGKKEREADHPSPGWSIGSPGWGPALFGSLRILVWSGARSVTRP